MATPQQLQRLHAVVPFAQACAKQYGVPASVTLAQWIDESSWGLSKLAMRANNCFGVKCSNLGNPESYVQMPTAEYENGKRVLVMADFARYASAAESFAAHASLLACATRYAPAMAVAQYPDEFAEELQKCGYSTSPTYAADLLQLIRDYNLTQYDTTPPAQPAALEKAA